MQCRRYVSGFVFVNFVVPIWVAAQSQSDDTLLDTDLSTFAEFQNCFTGSNNEPSGAPRPVPPACLASFDINGDLTIDLVDARSVLFPPLCNPRWAKDLFSLDGINLSYGGGVYALTVFDDGTGPALYAGGGFTSAGGVAANNIAKWNGASWSALGSGLDDDVIALTVFDDGMGPALYAGGTFFHAGGNPASRIAKWKGSSWSALGSGMNDYVATLAVFNDGTGSALYAGGNFSSAGGTPANSIAKWNGSSWSALGSGFSGFLTFSPVWSLADFNDGTGSALYAGGFFYSAGGTPANSIAQWNGSSWSALGSELDRGDAVSALCVFNDGTGPALYAGGTIYLAGGTPVNNIAKWNGSSWSALGTGITGVGVGQYAVYDLAVFHDGRRTALYAGGFFDSAGGTAVHNIAKWNGSTWKALGSGVSGGDRIVSSLAAFDDGTRPALYAGGSFSTAGGNVSLNIAKWYRPYWPCP